MVSSAYLRLMFCYKDTITVSHYHIKKCVESVVYVKKKQYFCRNLTFIEK